MSPKRSQAAATKRANNRPLLPNGRCGLVRVLFWVAVAVCVPPALYFRLREAGGGGGGGGWRRRVARFRTGHRLAVGGRQGGVSCASTTAAEGGGSGHDSVEYAIE